jgi:hypothetical protein
MRKVNPNSCTENRAVELPAALFSDVTGQNAFTPNPHDYRSPTINWVFLGQRTALMRGADAVAPSMIRRVSVHGIGLLHAQAIPVGEQFTMLLPRQGGQPVPVLCSAVRCEEGGWDGLFRIGAVFEAVLADEYATPLRAAAAA